MARDFNGSSQYLYTSTQIVSSAYPLTLAAWYYCNTASGGDETLVSLADIPSADNQYIGVDPTNGYVHAGSDGTGGNNQATSPASYAQNTWQHAAGVFASATSRIAYINGSGGTANTTSTTVTTPTAGSIAVIDWGISQTAYFDGSIAEVAVWNIDLTATEIAILAYGYSPVLVRPESLISYWPLAMRTSPEIDLLGSATMTLSGSPAAADHPATFWHTGLVTSPLELAIIGGLFRRRLIFAG